MPLRKKDTSQRIDYDAPTSEGIEITYDAEGNVYAEALDKGHRIDPRAQVVFVLCVLLVVVYFLGLIIPKDLLNAAYHNSGYNGGYTLSWFVADLQDNVTDLLAVLTGNAVTSAVFTNTMIRYVVVALAGAGLALCGAVYQGTFRNALVTPSTLGVMSGATLGMMVWVVSAVTDDGENAAWLVSAESGFEASGNTAAGYLIGSYSLAICSFVGCLLVVGIVLLTMRVANAGRLSGIMMIITGQVIGGIMGAVTNTVRYYYVATNPTGLKAQLLTDLTIASFYRTFSIADVVAVSIPLVVTFAVIMVLRQRMVLLAFSEEESRSMGIDAKRLQAVVIILCTLLTAIIVSFCGRVGFVGFLVPHLARRLVGPGFKHLLPACAVLGAVFVLGAYALLAITLGPAYETMVGMFISIAGAAVFLVTALRGKGGFSR